VRHDELITVLLKYVDTIGAEVTHSYHYTS